MGLDPTQAKELLAAMEAAGIPIPTQLSGSNFAFAEAVPGSGAGDDSNDLTSVADSTYDSASFLYVGTSGDVVVTTGGSDLTFASLAAGVWHPMPPFTRVKATNTTASDLIAGYWGGYPSAGALTAGGGGGGATAYRAYRLYITATERNDRVYISEIYFYDDADADLVVTEGGTAFANNIPNPERAFDRAIPEAGYSDVNLPEIIGWDFGAGNEQAITKYAIKGPGGTNRDPQAWTLQGSNDTTTGLDGTWIDLDSQTGQDFTVPKEVKTYEL